MSPLLKCKKAIVIIITVFVFFWIQIEAFAGADWKRITEMPTGRSGFAAAVVENKVYIIGGTLFKNPEGPYGSSTLEVYDPQNHTWRRLIDMPTPRHGARSAVVNGIIYVFGGYSSKDRLIKNWKLPVHTEAYDPQTDTWVQRKDMLVSRINFRLGVFADKVYLIGGTTGFGEAHEQRMDRVDVYDPSTDSWARGTNMPTRRDPLAVSVVNNRMYVIGGRGWPQAVDGGPVLKVIEAYKPVGRRWTQKRDMLDVKNGFETVVVKDEIYLIGGSSQGRFLSTVDVYSPEKEAWRESPELPILLSPYGAATVNGRIYVFGGYNRERGHIPDVLVFDTRSRAVEAKHKLTTRWGELKGKRPAKP